jgi:hypothetical protein
MHDFFGARGVDAFTTAGNIGALGTTCEDQADRAAYWAPALINPATGQFFIPTRVLAYYRASKGNPVSPFPFGFQMVAGNVVNAEDFGFACGAHPPYSSVPIDCPGDHLKLHINFPNCWDGVDILHPAMVYGGGHCPAAFPISLPKLGLHFQYIGLANGGSYLTAPNLDGTHPLPHADFINAFDPAAQQLLIDTCVNNGGSCVPVVG